MKKDKNTKNDASKRGFFERLNTGLDIDCDMLLRGFRAELRGKKRAEIAGVKRIYIYTREKISFVTFEGIFSIVGKDLSCSSLKCGSATVEGDVLGMGFDDGGKNGNS
ncbi:MAG: YabP/YqfC family sporulation protein [Clostridia bacterium]|nr:YabP/YqfC family sporulation protein [Clostridia bacterium]